MCVYTLTSCCNGIVIYSIMRLVIISYKSIIRFGKVLTKKLTTQHQKTMFSSLSRSAKSLSVTTTIQKLSSSRRSVVDKKVFSKTPATTSPVAAILRTARVVRAESGDGVRFEHAAALCRAGYAGLVRDLMLTYALGDMPAEARPYAYG